MLKIDDTALVLIDVQERLLKAMHDKEALLTQLKKLIAGANALNIPIIWFEQYPKGLGPTVREVKDLLMDNAPIEKLVFSGYEDERLEHTLDTLHRHTVIIAGIEAHICVYQTARDLLEEDFHVEVAVDCIASRKPFDKEIALEKMQAFGASVTTVEMALFELIKTAEHPKFKEISQLIK